MPIDNLPGPFDVIIGSDLAYDADLFEPLAATLEMLAPTPATVHLLTLAANLLSCSSKGLISKVVFGQRNENAISDRSCILTSIFEVAKRIFVCTRHGDVRSV